MKKTKWIPIEQVYPNASNKYGFLQVYDYDPLLASFGYEILLKVDQSGYQGDSWVLYRDGDQFGYLQFGWGSCSGCDALRACNSYKEIDELRQELHDSIRWGTAEELLHFMETHDWEGDWSGRTRECQEFVRRAKKILRAEVRRRKRMKAR